MAASETRSIKRPLVASSLFIAAGLAGCNLLPVSQGTLYAAAVETAPVDDQSQLMYEVMIAELAGRRGYVDIATEGYFNAAMRTDDPRVSERATKLAVWGRRWQQAELVGQRWATLDPDNPEVRQLLAQVYMRQGNSESAASELAALIQTIGSDSAKGMADVYQFLLREPNRTMAIETMTHLRDKYAEDSYASLVLGQLAFDSRDYEVALEAVNKSIELKPDNNSALLLRVRVLTAMGDAERGFEELREALTASPEDIELQLGYARLLVEAGRYDEAAVQFDVCYELGIDNGGAMVNLGLLALESRRNGAAEKYFSRLLALGEFTNEAHFYLGRIADSQQDHKKAILHYEQVATGDNYLDAQIRAAEIYGLTGRLELGRERLNRLGATNQSPQLQQRLVRAEGRMLLDSGQPEQAVSVLSEGLEQFPDSADLLYARALAAERGGDSDMFENDLRQLIASEPENAHAMNALGYYYADENINLEEADVLLVKANELLPEDPAILDSLGWLRFRQGKHEEAIELLKRAYALLKDAEIAAHLGEVMWVTGDQKAAREVWTRALLERPDDPTLKNVVERFEQ